MAVLALTVVLRAKFKAASLANCKVPPLSVKLPAPNAPTTLLALKVPADKTTAPVTVLVLDRAKVPNPLLVNPWLPATTLLIVRVRFACVTLMAGEPEATCRVNANGDVCGTILTSCDGVVSVKVMLPMIRTCAFTATLCVAVYSPTNEAVLPLPLATVLLNQLPVPPQIPVPAAPVHVPLCACEGLMHNAMAKAAARIPGIRRRREARTRTRLYLDFIV